MQSNLELILSDSDHLNQMISFLKYTQPCVYTVTMHSHHTLTVLGEQGMESRKPDKEGGVDCL